ncbi:class I SAM-dependent methyltransferase [Cryptosporangium minutisporangium]|uniref:Class I SAM-dependent methyltransferase n=1 Tax=Cryptosporangium minutisporangium TaxID=113569 RepID=A0ABP6T2F4_9ACTN
MTNAAQRTRWNGDTGRRWLAERARHTAVRRRLVPQLLRAAALRAGDHVLDVGCGCGDLTIEVARRVGPAGRVVGLDFSAPLLEVARREARDADLRCVSFVHGDAQVHPLPAAAYDVVISSFGVMFFDDPAAAFARFRTALRPGGRLVFLCWQSEDRNEVFSIPLHAVRDCGGRPVPDPDPFADPEWIATLLTSVGFADARVQPVHQPARLGSDVPDVLAYVTTTSRVRALLAALDDAPADRALAAMAARFDARQRPDGVWVRASAWLVTAG